MDDAVSTLVVFAIAGFFVAFLGLIWWDWRKDERTNPATRFRGVAPIRFLKHLAMRLIDGLLGAFF